MQGWIGLDIYPLFRATYSKWICWVESWMCSSFLYIHKMPLYILYSNELFFILIVKLKDLQSRLFFTVTIIFNVEIQMFLHCLITIWTDDKNSGPPSNTRHTCLIRIPTQHIQRPLYFRNQCLRRYATDYVQFIFLSLVAAKTYAHTQVAFRKLSKVV